MIDNIKVMDSTNAQCAFWVVQWPCSQNGPVSDTIRRRGGYRGIFREEEVDTGPYFRELHGSRVWNSRFPHESCFPSNQTSRDKYMLNNFSRRNFKDISQLVGLEGKHTTQNAHCAMLISWDQPNIFLLQMLSSFSFSSLISDQVISSPKNLTTFHEIRISVKRLLKWWLCIREALRKVSFIIPSSHHR